MISRKKFYILRRSPSGHVVYKRYKNIEGWSSYKRECWQFSERGAKEIVKKSNQLAEKYGGYAAGKYEIEAVI